MYYLDIETMALERGRLVRKACADIEMRPGRPRSDAIVSASRCCIESPACGEIPW